MTATVGIGKSLLPVAEFEDLFYKTVGRYRWENPTETIKYVRGTPTREGMKTYALEHCNFAENFPRWFGHIVANCPHLSVRQYMIRNMYIEEVEDPTIKNGHYEKSRGFRRGARRDA